MRISARSNIDDVLGFTSRLHPQYRFAVAKALTDTVKAVQAVLPGEMTRVLDRPSAFTRNGVFVKPARKDVLRATVGFKPKQAAYLSWQVEGGMREPDRVALRLPSVVALNESGNIPSGLIRQLIARAKAGRRATKRQAGRFGVSQDLDLFYGEPGDGRPAGIYKRVVISATRHQLVPIVVFPKREARYRVRLDFYGYASLIVERSIATRLAGAWAFAKISAR